MHETQTIGDELEMLPSLDNFVSFGTDIFRARPDYRQNALDIYTTSLASDHSAKTTSLLLSPWARRCEQPTPSS
ncbi:hypothetical protein BGW80DRAFT_1392972 [Lactifluus volemus]|nr:hypothetical protein BGW80DRAFT_1392972 [Lactifluus volemus]